jgi:hypothetical protein
MSAIVVIRFQHRWAAEDLEHAAQSFAREQLPKIAGLHWKCFLDDRDAGGGIYHFASRADAQAYVDGPVVAALRAAPGIMALRAEVYDLMAGPSALARAPLTHC